MSRKTLSRGDLDFLLEANGLGGDEARSVGRQLRTDAQLRATGSTYTGSVPRKRVSAPAWAPLRLWARANTRQVVSRSGTRTFSSAWPLRSVITSGRKRKVSGNHVLARVPCSAWGLPSGAPPTPGRGFFSDLRDDLPLFLATRLDSTSLLGLGSAATGAPAGGASSSARRS